MSHESVIVVEGLEKSFKIGDNEIKALRGVNLAIQSTEFVVIFGPSGCGKTTLLNIISGIEKPTKGKMLVRGTNLFEMSDENRGIFRAQKMGIVHQMPYWVKSLTVLENVALPLIIEGEKEKAALEHAKKVMNELGISDLMNQKPSQLSGGQQQKAGLARALVSNPWIILADEPTGNLDSKSANEIMSIFKMLNEKYKRTIVLVTHNKDYWNVGTKRIEMHDGLIAKEVKHG